MGHDYEEYQFDTMMDYYLNNPEYLDYDRRDDGQLHVREDVIQREIIIIKEVEVEVEAPKRELIIPAIIL